MSLWDSALINLRKRNITTRDYPRKHSVYMAAYGAEANLKKRLLILGFVRRLPGSDFVQSLSSTARTLWLRDFHSILPQRL